MKLPRLTFGQLRKRVAELERDVAQAERDRKLVNHWRHELGEAQSQLAAAQHVAHEQALPRFGVDYSFDRPSLTGLREHGVTFACRYLTGQGKRIDHNEAELLSKGGIDIVALFEEGARNMAEGRAQGVIDGRLAAAAARELGVPLGRPIYFCCDYEATDERPIDYLRGAQDVMRGEYEAGIYGGLFIVGAAFRAGFRFAFQTIGWSHGEWNPRAQLRQTSVTGPVIEGNACDTNWAQTLDFGQWRLRA